MVPYYCAPPPLLLGGPCTIHRRCLVTTDLQVTAWNVFNLELKQNIAMVKVTDVGCQGPDRGNRVHHLGWAETAVDHSGSDAVQCSHGDGAIAVRSAT